MCVTCRALEVPFEFPATHLGPVHAQQPHAHREVHGIGGQTGGVTDRVHGLTVAGPLTARMSEAHPVGRYPSNIVSSAVPPPPDGDPADALQPSVAVVMVAHDPGDWFKAALDSVVAQTYANVSLMVVDTASATAVADRVTAVVPDAVVRRLDTNPGFGPACNEVRHGIAGAAFYLFCHDDIVLAPDAVTLMVAEAFRANAGVVGPKLVRYDEPDRLLALGMGCDRFGQPAALVERGELDQGQHDAIRDVFFVPGAATLVRADLFGALDGFDPDIDLHGEDLDLCWRARLAGASVVVAPAATVRHIEALADRRSVDDRRRLQMAHRLRTLRVCSSTASRLWLVPLLFVAMLAEALTALVMGRWRHMTDLFSAWTWNRSHRHTLKQRRDRMAAVRAVADRDVRSVQVRGSARARALIRARRAAGEPVDGDSTAAHATEPMGWWGVGVWIAVAVVLVVGSRSLMTGRVPAVGDFVLFPSSAGELLSSWWSAWRPVGLGAPEVSPPLLGVFWLVSVLSFGATALARTVLILAALPVAAIGVWRLATPLGSPRVRIVALMIAVANPLTYDAVSTGRWSTLVMCAVTPWIVLHIARGARLEPFGSPRRPLFHLVSAGVLVGVATLWLPAAPAIVTAMVLAVVVGGWLVGSWRGTGGLLYVGLGSVVVALVLCAPWLAGIVTGSVSEAGWSVWLGATLGGAMVPSGGEILRFQTGPVGSSVLGWALPLAATPALLFGRKWRLVWAARAWMIVVVGWAAVAAIGQGWLGTLVPVPDVLLAPSVAGLALAGAAGTAAFERDLSGYRAGWRQVASLVAAVAVVVALVPVVGSAFDGRWDLPTRDIDDKLAFMADERAAEPFRVLWVTEADLLPLAGWPLDAPSLGTDAVDDTGATLLWGTTDNGLPGPDNLFTVAPPPGTEQMAEALSAAAAGDTDRLGALVGPMGVRYIVVPLRLAPGASELLGSVDTPTTTVPPTTPNGSGPTVTAGTQDSADANGSGNEAEASGAEIQTPGAVDPTVMVSTPVTAAGAASVGLAGVVDLLSRQLDLSALPVGGDVRVWANTQWVPSRALFAPDDVADLPDSGPEAVPGLADDATGILPDGVVGTSGDIGQSGSVYVAQQYDEGWTFTTTAGDASRNLGPTEVLGWAMRFEDVNAGAAALGWTEPLSLRLLIVATPLLWLMALWFLIRNRALVRRPVGDAEAAVVGDATGDVTAPIGGEVADATVRGGS